MCQICTKMYNPPSLLITCLTDWLVVLQCAPAAVAACMNVIIQPTWLILFDSSARARLAKQSPTRPRTCICSIRRNMWPVFVWNRVSSRVHFRHQPANKPSTHPVTYWWKCLFSFCTNHLAVFWFPILTNAHTTPSYWHHPLRARHGH